MEPEGFLLLCCSQEASSDPCAKPDEFSLHSHVLFVISLNIILRSVKVQTL
jgi:hypothetical protein